MVRINVSNKTRYSNLVEQLSIARNSKMQLEESIHAMERELISLMENDQQKTVTVGTHRVTYVRPTKVVVDESGLRKALGAKTFDKFTVAKLDRKKLEDAIDKEEVDPLLVSPYVRVEEGNPYVRYSERKADSGA